MIPVRNSAMPKEKNMRKTLLLASLFFFIAASGLFYVKWWPYYHKALTAAAQHSIGSSILSGAHAENALSYWNAALQYTAAYFKSVWKAAVLGMLLGSLVQVLLPADWIYRFAGKSSFKSTLMGGIAALPGMMCSCCAAPIASGMRKCHASIGATLAFWLGNPVLNPATLIFMTFVLSWKFTVIRLLFGIILTFGISYAANRFFYQNEVPGNIRLQQPHPTEHRSFWVRWLRSFGTMFLHVVPVYVGSVLVLGALQSFMFPVWLNEGIWAIVVFALAGTLFVIPTAAEIPIIQSFLSFGVGTGPAAALLLTLPAVSLPSILLVSKSFPRKVLWFVVLAVIGIGILSGLAGALWL